MLTCSLVMLLLAAGSAIAQGTITGKVIDPQNKPVPKLEVLLHAVTGSTGRQVDRDTTNAEGRFSLNVGTVKDSAIYFVAVIWNGQLYVGDMMRPPFPSNKDYVVQVGVNPVDAGPSTTTQAPNVGQPAVETPSDRKAGTIVVIVAALAIAGVLYFALRRRPPARRRWLVELARIEDEIETSGTSDALQRRRAELRERLRAPQGS